MAKITFSGMDAYMSMLQNLEADSERIAKMALYEGAKIAADELRKGVDSLPVQEEWGTKADPAKGIKSAQKKGLQDGLGISDMRNENGFINVSIGFHGYNSIKTKAHPNGQPNAMIARSVESGSSFMRKTPFVSRAVRKTKKMAEEKMQQTFEEEINKIMKE